MKKTAFILAAVAALLAALPARAQSGCVDSPENPTAVLGLIAGAASLGFHQLRQFRARKNNKLK